MCARKQTLSALSQLAGRGTFQAQVGKHDDCDFGGNPDRCGRPSTRSHNKQQRLLSLKSTRLRTNQLPDWLDRWMEAGLLSHPPSHDEEYLKKIYIYEGSVSVSQWKMRFKLSVNAVADSRFYPIGFQVLLPLPLHLLPYSPLSLTTRWICEDRSTGFWESDQGFFSPVSPKQFEFLYPKWPRTL